MSIVDAVLSRSEDKRFRNNAELMAYVYTTELHNLSAMVNHAFREGLKGFKTLVLEVNEGRYTEGSRGAHIKPVHLHMIQTGTNVSYPNDFRLKQRSLVLEFNLRTATVDCFTTRRLTSAENVDKMPKVENACFNMGSLKEVSAFVRQWLLVNLDANMTKAVQERLNYDTDFDFNKGFTKELHLKISPAYERFGVEPII